MDMLLDLLGRPYAGFAAALVFILVLWVIWFVIGRLFLARRVRKLYLVVLFILNLSIAYWVIMEGYFRFVYDESDSFAILQTHNMWLGRNVRMNDFNLRDDRDYAPLRGRNDLVFLLGDSYQWGQGINFEETVTAHLQKAFPEYTFLNISGQGLSTAIELDNLKKMIAYGFKPKIVVLNYYMNDIDSYGAIVRNDSISRKTERINSLRFSYSIQHIYARIAKFSFKGHNLYADLLANAYHSSLFDKHKEEIIEIVNISRTNGAGFLLVMWPALPVQEGSNDVLNETREVVLDVMKESHAEFIDLFSDISKLDKESQVAGKFDAHPSAAVHGIAAKAVAVWISAQKDWNRGM